MSVDPAQLIIHDTAPIVEGSTARDTLLKSVELAQLGDRIGYHRYWTAETHGMRAVASCAPAVVCAQVAARTTRIRVGAAGVLLPNHSALVVSEQFGTLEAFHPSRIDLALGHSPGGPRSTVDLINPDRDGSRVAFARQIDQLRGWFRHEYHEDARSVTGYGNEPTLWMLGTNPESAELAGEMGLPYAFGGHLHAAAIDPAVQAYRAATNDAEEWTPHLAVSVGVIAADTAEEADHLAGPYRLKVASRTLRGERMLLPLVETAAARRFTDPDERRVHDATTADFIIGDGPTVRRELGKFRDRTGADELIISTPVSDHGARLHSYALAAGAA